jgi:hypothetical protein
MWPSIVALIVFVAFLFYLGYAFLYDVAQLVINGAIIYFVGLRTFVELNGAEKEVGYAYTFSAIIALGIVSITGSFIPFVWSFTIFLVLTLIIKHILMYARKHYKKLKK